MKTVLYQVPYSPYCIAIAEALDAAGVSYRSVAAPLHRRGALIRITGGRYYQVPLLVHGKRMVYDESADGLDVARHVDREFWGGGLFPAVHEGMQRILIPHIENDVEAVTFRLTDPLRIPKITDLVERTEAIRFKERRFGRGCLEVWRKEAPVLRKKTFDLLEPFDLILRGSAFIFGKQPVYSDYALSGIIGALTFGGHVRLPKGLNSLERWRRDLKRWQVCKAVI
ncbi:MAG: glutathione S-transferase N-terminal domain-containing protein [Opitutaceae bacterium]|nr:glutathione S-transferase N-terminal domain-containing protein [Opitutaceae bacterium]